MRQALVRFLVALAHRPSSFAKKLGWIALGMGTFLFLSPWLLGKGVRALRQGLAPFVGVIEGAVGILGLGAGLSIVGWVIAVQWRLGAGTPMPAAPTQRVVTSGPYALCRHPMYFAAVLYHLGFVTMTSGLGPGVAAAGGVAAFVVFYARTVEERELEARFGEEYRAYRARTPFLFPRGKDLWEVLRRVF
ncbi:MAG TPA: isoprenylcysteine carboxylmethyltransferase family protein [Synergistaceae bacterium]|nr:isoprenylcysteine carboxylmethyltransferase family protein [Synergistaceae bacterium]